MSQILNFKLISGDEVVADVEILDNGDYLLANPLKIYIISKGTEDLTAALYPWIPEKPIGQTIVESKNVVTAPFASPTMIDKYNRSVMSLLENFIPNKIKPTHKGTKTLH